MTEKIGFTPQVRDWIAHNIERGVPPAPLLRTMVEQGFDPAGADALVHAVWAALAQGGPLPEQALDAAQIQQARYRRQAPRLAPGSALDAGDRMVRAALRQAAPTAALLDDVMTPIECDLLMAMATPRLTPSTMVDPASGRDLASAARSSDGMFFRLAENPLVARIDQRLSTLMNLPLEHGEGLQVLRYRPGAQSMPHFDFLMQTNPANRASVARSGQRVSTLIVYLNDVAAGGETTFPESGLAVTPRQGCGLYFEYCNSDGQLDPASLHAAEPVRQGEKWIVTKWMRERPFVPAGGV